MTNLERRRLVDRIKTMEGRSLMVVNPMSRRGSELASRIRSLVRREGMNLEETSTDHPSDLGSTIEFWSKRFGGSRVIMVFGGDGAINQVINNIMLSKSNKNVVLVPIPAGTANDFCRALDFNSIEETLGAMVDFNIRTIDLLKMEVDGTGRTTKFCGNILGLGIDGDLAHRSQKYRRFGVVGYWYASLKKAAIAAFRGVETYRLRINVGGFKHDGPVVGVMFSNISTYGRNFRIAPGAKPDDGKIYVTIAKPMSGLRAFISGLLLLKGQHSRMPTVDTFNCEEADIELMDDIYAQEDGEVYFYPRGTKIRLSVELKALNVLAPSTNSAGAP